MPDQIAEQRLDGMGRIGHDDRVSKLSYEPGQRCQQVVDEVKRALQQPGALADGHHPPAHDPHQPARPGPLDQQRHAV